MSEHIAGIADALGPRYRVERTLQSGAAAHVYLAEDRLRAQWVAVKVLREEMAATVDAERFIAEIRCCAELRHPNVVPVYEWGEAGGLPYYVMPFIDGETLRARLARLGRLPLADALRIAEDVGRALDFAHRHHIVHRDIKPENVMLVRDRALVLDFGIALALDALDAPRRTLPGLTLGTVHYMSPEQAAGESRVDGRSDVYSLACVIYEMLSGCPPFSGSPPVVIRRHLTGTPRPLSAACPGSPPALGPVVARALEKAPDARYPTAGAFLSALLGAAPRVRVIGRRTAVLPFTHVGAEPVVDAFSDGLGEDVAFALRGFEGIAVTPRCSIGQNGARLHVAAIARELGADVLVLGEVRDGTAPDRVELSAVLYDGHDGRKLWSGTVAGGWRGASHGESEAATELARAVGRALGRGPLGRGQSQLEAFERQRARSLPSITPRAAPSPDRCVRRVAPAGHTPRGR